jgi:hypothetical protein
MSVETEKKNIDIFIESLRKRLHEKAEQGYVGWDYGHRGLDDLEPDERGYTTASTPDLLRRLEMALEDEKFIDVAAFASMLWRRQVVDFEATRALGEKI